MTTVAATAQHKVWVPRFMLGRPERGRGWPAQTTAVEVRWDLDQVGAQPSCSTGVFGYNLFT